MIDDNSLLASASKNSLVFGASRAVQTVFRLEATNPYKSFRPRHRDHPDIVRSG